MVLMKEAKRRKKGSSGVIGCINLYVDGPLVLRYGYFMPHTSMIRYADIPKENSRFFS
jgi:hypothetical protein